MELSLEDARCVFIDSQRLGAGKELIPTIEQTGFLRTLGGVEVYLASRARVRNVRRKDLDGAVENSHAQVVPAVRGCMYLVPQRDIPLALSIAELLSSDRLKKEHAKAGIKDGEVEEVSQAVLALLKKQGPLTADVIRKELPAGTLRSLGEKGKKVGISSALPGALRLLEFAGKVERSLEGGHLDTERYRWRIPKKSPFGKKKISKDPLDLYASAAEIFVRGAGIASVKDLSGWIGTSLRDTKAAVERGPFTEVTVEGLGHCIALDGIEKMKNPKIAKDTVALLPFEDNLVAFHGGWHTLVDEAHHDVKVEVWGSSKTTIGAAKHPSFRSIVGDGKIVGFWEYDPKKQDVAIALFDRVRPKTLKAINAEADATAKFLSKEIGHGRSFSLDTDEDLIRRAALVRKIG